KARIGFLVYQLRRSLRCAELQPPDAARPVVVVQRDVEQRAAVGRPERRAGGLFDWRLDALAAVDAPYMQGIALRALQIAPEGEIAMARAVRDPAEAEIGVLCGLAVAVQEHLLAGFVVVVIARAAAEDRMLAGCAKTHVIGPVAIRCGHAGVFLRDAAAHFRDQRAAQLRR